MPHWINPGNREKALATVVRPGRELLQYLDEEGERHTIDSSDVNDYLREITGSDYTAKDFRTWAGTVLAARALEEFDAFETSREARRNIITAIEAVARTLGNTPAICKKCYVRPIILETYLDGTSIEMLERKAEAKLGRELPRLLLEEVAVLMLLREHLHDKRV